MDRSTDRSLQTPGAAAWLGVPESAFQIRMHVLTADDALGVLCRSVWWLWPVRFLLLLPGFRELGRAAYNWFARNRYGIGGACRVHPNRHRRAEFVDWAAAGLLPALAGFSCRDEAPWLLMWALAFGFGCALKWLMWRDAISHGACPSAKRTLVWFLLWPGLDGRACFAKNAVGPPEAREWIDAAAVTPAGAALIWLAVPLLLFREAATATAWMGMLGIVLLYALWRDMPPLHSLATLWGECAAYQECAPPCDVTHGLLEHAVEHGLHWEVVILTRIPSRAGNGVREVLWDGKTFGHWTQELDGASAVINLAGRSVNCRYHARHRREILESRIFPTRVLGLAIAGCVNRRPFG